MLCCVVLCCAVQCLCAVLAHRWRSRVVRITDDVISTAHDHVMFIMSSHMSSHVLSCYAPSPVVSKTSVIVLPGSSQHVPPYIVSSGRSSIRWMCRTISSCITKWRRRLYRDIKVRGGGCLVCWHVTYTPMLVAWHAWYVGMSCICPCSLHWHVMHVCDPSVCLLHGMA